MKLRKNLIFVIIAAMMVSLLPAGGVMNAEAKSTWTLSHTSRTIKTGGTKNIAIKNATASQLKKAKWKVIKGADVVSFTVNKKNSRAAITGKKAGTAKISVRIGSTKKTCVIKVKKTSTGYSEEVAETALTMLKGLRAAEKDPSNTLISPDSILSCLSMTANGAKGDTLAEMKKVFGVKDIADYSAYWKETHDRLTSVNENKNGKVSYNVANSIWTNSEKVTLSEDFVKENKAAFDAEIQNVKFDDSAVSQMNSWVKKNTNGMIDKIIDKLEKDDRAVLINAIGFEGQWGEQYEDRQIDENGTFTTAAKKKQKVTMLSGTEEGRAYMTLNGGDGFIKYYTNGDFAFFAYLPPEGKSVDDYLSGISGAEFIGAYNNRQDVKVITKMPEFKYDYSTSLKKQLQDMGMTLSFSNDADFTGMLDLKKAPDQDRLKISDVIHKTHIEVDRNGTKAAAATAVIMAKTTAFREEKEPVYITLDRPFVYGILDTETGMPLFIGTLDEVK
ncbi:MAG: serpin family protein [Lachnospiraceae bacterium]|nr:serpin family protein [Lachnospiraceae bacterium]